VSDSLPRRPWGRSGEEVSALGLGGYHLGLPSESEATRIMHRAIDAGMTFFDNCWSYHAGESERRMGQALMGGKRDRVFLMTKIDARTGAAATGQLEDCLRRLRTDRIDLVQIHEVGTVDDAPWVFSEDGAIAALQEARRAGKVRYVGFTGHKSPDVHLAMLEQAEKNGFVFDAVQMPLNVMDAHYESFLRRVLPELTARGIAAIGMKALGSGDILKTGEVSAEECLRFALSQPAATVVTGCDSMAVLEQALKVGQSFRPLEPEQERALLARTRRLAQGGHYERFKTTTEFDSLERNPHWRTGASL
jgi:aryl-alcohol dehydrogenase-like predicted oxidoreductase